MKPIKISDWTLFAAHAVAMFGPTPSVHVATQTMVDGETRLVIRGNMGVSVTHHGVVSPISGLHKELEASFSKDHTAWSEEAQT